MPINININTRTIIGKVKARSQFCRLYTDDGRELIIEPSVRKGCIADDEKVSGWAIEAENQVQDEETGIWYQLLDDRSCLPIPAVTGKQKVKDLQKLVDQIFHDSWVIDLIQMNNEARRNRHITWLYVILGTPILLAALILGLKVLKL